MDGEAYMNASNVTSYSYPVRTWVQHKAHWPTEQSPPINSQCTNASVLTVVSFAGGTLQESLANAR